MSILIGWMIDGCDGMSSGSSRRVQCMSHVCLIVN